MRREQKASDQKRAIDRLRRRYVRTVKIGGKWNTYLQIDHQEFSVVENANRQRALWYGKMLAVALARLVTDSNAGARAALEVICTWASFRGGELLTAKATENLCRKALNGSPR